MMRATARMPLAVVLGLGLAGCSDSTGLSSEALETIGGGLTLGIVETYRYHDMMVGEPELALFLETKGWFPCVNYRLDVDMQTDGDEVSLTSLRVIEPEACLTAIGPAFAYLSLPFLEGDYSLAISYAGVTDSYQASISPVSIDLSPRKGRFSERQYKRLWRRPPRSFALMCDAEQWGEEICAELDALFLAELDLAEIAFGDDGTNPYPTDRKEAGRDWRASYFQLAREEGFPLVRQVFCSFVSTRSNFDAYIRTWKNEEIRSWVPSSCPSSPGTP